MNLSLVWLAKMVGFILLMVVIAVWQEIKTINTHDDNQEELP